MTPKEAKERCGYQAKPVHPACANCGAFASDLQVPAWMVGEFEQEGVLRIHAGASMRIYKDLAEVPDHLKVEKNLRCTDHGFAIKKTAVCALHRPRHKEIKQ